ncbi:S24/S26 family peptidase [Leeuwenhoekiella aequorea]|uniref:S24 family peptidase n=1 Tax=Leeuwenhoekiella aequorea TaxID=283736 RepID=UPI00352F7978|tara:strand:- start:542 stop:1351 length:810 start_codon:yes stop_codon:yes gene_type:complete
MREISTFKERIIEYLDLKGIRKAQFYRDTGVSNGILNQTSGLTEDNVLRFLNSYDDINPVWFFSGNGSILKTENEPSLVKEESQEPYYVKGQMPKVITVSPEGDENIIMVPVPAQAGYLNGFGDSEFLETLPTYRLPNLNNGTFRIFEVKGHSMYPTIHSGALAVGEWCENWEDDIKDNQIYIIVSKEDGIVVKRCLNRIKKYNNLYLKSDNRREYPSYPIKPDDILEIWTLKTAFIYDFQDPADMYDRVNDLEARLMHVESTLPKINK